MAVPISEAYRRDVLRYEPSPRRVRVDHDGATIADTRDALVVWEGGHAVCVYAVPEADVDQTRLTRSATDVPDAHGGGATLYDVNGVEHAAWRFADPDLAGHICFVWELMDRWREESDEVIGHARDPYHRVDLRRSDRHVRVALDGTVLAESRRPALVFESTLPVRYYLAREDVRMDLLTPTETQTICAYKGRASYFAVGARADLAWTYEDPLEDAPPLRGLIAFLDEQLDVTVDGEPLARPQTQWSRGIRNSPRGGGSGHGQTPHGSG